MLKYFPQEHLDYDINRESRAGSVGSSNNTTNTTNTTNLNNTSNSRVVGKEEMVTRSVHGINQNAAPFTFLDKDNIFYLFSVAICSALFSVDLSFLKPLCASPYLYPAFIIFYVFISSLYALYLLYYRRKIIRIKPGQARE